MEKNERMQVTRLANGFLLSLLLPKAAVTARKKIESPSDLIAAITGGQRDSGGDMEGIQQTDFVFETIEGLVEFIIRWWAAERVLSGEEFKQQHV